MTNVNRLKQELKEINKALAALKKDSIAHKMLLDRRAEVEVQLGGAGAIAQNNSTALGQQAAMVGGDFKSGNINTGTQIGTQINITSNSSSSRSLPSSRSTSTLLG